MTKKIIHIKDWGDKEYWPKGGKNTNFLEVINKNKINKF